MRARLITWLLCAFAALPLPAAHAIGVVVGWGLILFPNQLRRIGRINVPLCLPELTAGQQRALLRRSLLEAGKTMCEAGALWRWPKPRLLALVKEVSGEQHVRAALAQGKGVILATPHLGAWEKMGLYSSAHYPVTSLYRPPRLKEMDALVRRGRERLAARSGARRRQRRVRAAVWRAGQYHGAAAAARPQDRRAGDLLLCRAADARPRLSPPLRARAGGDQWCAAGPVGAGDE